MDTPAQAQGLRKAQGVPQAGRIHKPWGSARHKGFHKLRGYTSQKAPQAKRLHKTRGQEREKQREREGGKKDRKRVRDKVRLRNQRN